MKAFRTIMLIAAVPAVIMLVGFFRMADDDLAERTVHRDAQYEECLDGSTASPDEMYCSAMADAILSQFSDMGFIQEIFAYGTYGIVPHYYHTPTPSQEMGVRRDIERHARLFGSDGSTRFTGEREEEYRVELERLKEADPFAISKSEMCDPDGAQMKAVAEQGGQEAVATARQGMKCDEPAK